MREEKHGEKFVEKRSEIFIRRYKIIKVAGLLGSAALRPLERVGGEKDHQSHKKRVLPSQITERTERQGDEGLSEH